jgi:hypothetical protein
MQRLCKHVFLIIERLYFLRGPCRVVELRRVEFRDASLPTYELGSRGIELSQKLKNNGKKGIHM